MYGIRRLLLMHAPGRDLRLTILMKLTMFINVYVKSNAMTQ